MVIIYKLFHLISCSLPHIIYNRHLICQTNSAAKLHLLQRGSTAASTEMQHHRETMHLESRSYVSTPDRQTLCNKTAFLHTALYLLNLGMPQAFLCLILRCTYKGHSKSFETREMGEKYIYSECFIFSKYSPSHTVHRLILANLCLKQSCHCSLSMLLTASWHADTPGLESVSPRRRFLTVG